MELPDRGVKAIFDEALEFDSPGERAAFLDQACAEVPELRSKVEALLKAFANAGSFLSLSAEPDELTGDSLPRPLAAAEAEPDRQAKQAAAKPPGEGPGTRLGRYKLLQQIGEGGMGVVYMAEQQEPVRRLVAVKILKAGMDSAQVIARFEAERQALALMDHPNIAKVLDGGTTSSGRPYFVMDLVKGIPITTHCDKHRLSLRQRLELFVPLCQALQHAHQKGIIHRDIKPSNVLVAPFDGKPVVKVIDFGVAKAMGQRLTERTLFTHLGTVLGTLEYMSPEQAELNNHDVDTRTDIFSLGVVLYELLTGTTPLTKERLKDTTLLETLRRIREEEPPRPSTRLSGSKESLPAISAQRQTEPAKLPRMVRGKLDWIVLKALDKDRNRRYATANSLADDIERYLRDEPVEACPPSATYRLRKFARRYRVPLVIATLFAALLVLAAILSVWLAMKAYVAERAALTSRDAAHQRADDLAWEDYIHRVNRAYREVQEDNIALAEGLLHGCPVERRGWEWRYVKRLCHSERLSVDTPAGGVSAIAFSPDGSLLATGSGGPFSVGKGGPNVELWERVTGHRRLSLRGTEHPIWSLAFSPDGTSLAVGERSLPAGSPQVALWDVRTGASLWNKYEPDLPQAMSVASPDGRRIATASADRTVKLWDTATGREVFTLRGHTAGVIALAFSPDGNRIVSAGLDDTDRVWDATPLPAGNLRMQETRDEHKETELQKMIDRRQAEESDRGRNNLSPEGRWGPAAASFAKFVEGDPTNLPHRYIYIMLLLKSRDRAGVRRACEDLLRRFGSATDPVQASRVAWYCVLAADAVSDPEELVRLTAAALDRLPAGAPERSAVLNTLGAALYRSGRFEEAVRRLTESIQARGGEGLPQGFAFLAMAHCRLGHYDEAKRWLDKLVAIQPKEGFDVSQDDVELRILSHEAQSLIRRSSP